MNAIQSSAIVQILVASAIIESVWEIVSMLFDPRDKANFKTRLGTIILGEVLAFSYNLNIVAYLGLTDHIPLTGVVLTGILISRGSNFTHDLLTRLGAWRQTLSVLTPINANSTVTPLSSIIPPLSSTPPTVTTTTTTTTPPINSDITDGIDKK